MLRKIVFQREKYSSFMTMDIVNISNPTNLVIQRTIEVTKNALENLVKRDILKYADIANHNMDVH